MARWFWLGCLFSALVFLNGCAPPGPKTMKVSGTVLLDDEPLPDGEVTLAGEGGMVPDVFPVKNGKFEGQAKPGRVKVQIRAYREAPPPPKDGTEPAKGSPKPARENIIPRHYNDETTLTADVAEGGLKPAQFKVTSK
jgi:hypothetical protein